MEGDPVALSLNPSRHQAEIGFAALLFAAAGWGWAEAGSYAGPAGSYPRVLCVLLMICTALVIVRSLVRTAPEGRLFDHAPRFAFGFAAIAGYIVAIDFAGYILPSLVFGIGLPLALGYRNLRLLVPVVVAVIAFIYLVFGVMLERPLPPDLLDPVLGMLR